MVNYYYKKNDFSLIHGDCLQVLKEFEEKSIDMIFIDPPYRLSNDGISCRAGKQVSVNKGDWDKSYGFDDDCLFIEQFLGHCLHVLKDDGTIWVSGTYHNIYKVGYIMQEMGLKIINDIIWLKHNAPPNLSCRYFTHSHETILWAKKTKEVKHTFNYQEMKHWDVSKDIVNNRDKQMRDVWDIPLIKNKDEIKFGKHPTQKPLSLLYRIISSSTDKGDLILDAFCGSGTTGIAAVKLERKFIGIELDNKFLQIAIKRYKALKEQKKLIEYIGK